MVVPFALAIGLGIALGIIGVAFAWMLAVAAACAALYMWNTRAMASKASDAPPGPRRGNPLVAYAGLLVLMVLVGGGGYLLGKLFGWAPGRLIPHI